MYSRSTVPDLLQNHEHIVDGETERVIKDAAATVYLVEAETTFSTRLECILAMILYPDVQERACAETDAVVDRDALPCFEHCSSLPYKPSYGVPGVCEVFCYFSDSTAHRLPGMYPTALCISLTPSREISSLLHMQDMHDVFVLFVLTRHAAFRKTRPDQQHEECQDLI
ncbi:hypothetical protein BV22DRAFT_1133846 [Leucogyrophana mollusca]|uniref:Uncharacterized protein n=1 Tax=Leucogyrophana mollusca TaxID=85980 RepID=A0ACB8B1K5_9AGAM|nr:hypothetical protein BV22DRAFT_1133846 [Leucogyrophana mollusca]